MPRRVLADVVGEVGDLGQAQLLALVQVHRARQGEGEQGGRTGAAQAPVEVADPVVGRPAPCACGGGSTSWFDSTQVGGAPTLAWFAMVSSIDVRILAAFQPASR